MTESPSVNLNWNDVLERNAFKLSDYKLFGWRGFIVTIKRGMDAGSIVVTETDYPEEPGIYWMHVSMSFKDRLPTYDEIVIMHRAFFGRRRWSYQVFAPDDKHINIHANALHLWGRSDGKPAFTWEKHIAELGSI